MYDKEFYVTDEVYFMYENKITRGIITDKLNIKRESIHMPDMFYRDYYREDPARIISSIKTYNEKAYHVALYPKEGDVATLNPLNFCIDGSFLFDSKEDLIDSLRNSPC